MQEFEPKKRSKILTKEFVSNHAFVLLLAVFLFVGITYGYTFFKENKKVASGSITTAALTINFTDRNISASNLSVPTSNQEGLSEFVKTLTITNQTTTDGVVKLNLTRTSGLNLTDMSYALVVNGAIQEIGDVPSDGEILEAAIMGNETLGVELRLWPKTTYSGSETTFVGEITPEIKYLGPTVADINNSEGKYVEFNCNGSTCEKWQIVKVEDDRLVLTRQSDYTNATSRTNSERYDTSLTFNDNSLITSVSTDGKNVYLAKTVKITGGDGTVDNPYILENNIYNEEDKKVIAVITYKDGSTTIGTQNVYYNETNYISQVLNNPAFQYWDDGTNHYNLGDVVNFTSDTLLTAVRKLNSTITLVNNNVNLTYGTNGENAYTFNGDGTISCTSSDTTKVTCNVNTTTSKIELTVLGATTTDVTIEVSALEGTNYFAPTPQTFTVNVTKAESICPTTSNYSGTYDASAHSINVAANASGGTAYYRIDGGSWSTTNPSITNAGTSIVDVKVVGDTNHNDNTSCASRTISISKATTIMTLSETSGEIACEDNTTVNITTNGDGVITCSSSDTNIATCTVSNNTLTINHVAEGSATITILQDAGNNYTSASETYSATLGECGTWHNCDQCYQETMCYSGSGPCVDRCEAFCQNKYNTSIWKCGSDDQGHYGFCYCKY